MNTFTNIWEKALSDLERFFAANNNSLGFECYIKSMKPDFEQDGVYYFIVVDDYIKEQITARFADRIVDTLRNVCLEEYGVEKIVDIMLQTQAESDLKNLINISSQPTIRRTTLNSGYTFDTFIVGNSNKLANAAGRAVAKNPGNTYNPLFIYGGVGLGKTHLMHAIANQVMSNNPNAAIIYVTSEAFTNEFIESIQKKTNEAFRRKYRLVDVLLIDDIQFISKGPGTQEELFHTFNTLYESKKQIIISSDKLPSEIPKLEQRLLSRFQWGLLADIGLPDFETRMAILQSKVPVIMSQTGCTMQIKNDVLSYIAQKDDTNIRDLEGALKKVIAYAHLYSMERPIDVISMEIAIFALKDFFIKSEDKIITPNLIIKTICEYFNITEEEITGKRKNREIAFPRQICMYLMRAMTELTYPKIGELLGGRDHSTVIHGDDVISQRAEHDIELQNIISDISAMLRE